MRRNWDVTEAQPRSRPRPRLRTANQAARLSGSDAFEAIFRDGSRLEGRYVQIISAPANQRSGRVGFVVGRKALRRAVDRNRLKRVLREFLRASRAEVRAFDLVIRLKRPVTAQTLSEVAREAADLIREATHRTSATSKALR